MYSTRHAAKSLCQRCSKTLTHFRTFHSVSEARNYHKQTSSLDPPNVQHQPELSWLAYLTSSTDLNIQETIDSLHAHQDKTAALQILLTQPYYQRSWEELKEVIGGVIREDPSNSTTILTGLITQFSLSDMHNQKRPLDQITEMQENKRLQLESFPWSTNLDRITVAYYWMRNNRLDLANSCFEDITLVEELDCFILLKGISLFPLNGAFNKMVVRDLIKFPDIPRLAAKLALFQPAKYEVISELLLRNKDCASDRITEFIEHLSGICESSEQIHDIICQLKLPEEEMVQVCLNLHQSGADQLFYTTFLTLSKSATLDIIPLISGQSSSSSPQTHIVHAILAFVRLGIKDLVPLLINKVSDPSFASFSRNNISKDGWITRVLNLKYVSFQSADYDALITPLSSSCRAQLIKKCCDEGTHLDFIKQAILNSYESQTLHEVMLFLLQQGRNLSAGDYVDDCLIHTCPSLSGGKILALIRFLADHSIVNSYQQKFWMIVAYDKKDDCEDLAVDILRELYGEQDISVYFSVQDLNNLMQLVSSEQIQRELRGRADNMVSIIEEFELSVLQRKSTPRLLLGGVNGTMSFQLLKENNLLYRVAQTFGVHSAIANLKTVTKVGKNCNDLVEFMKQIEVNEDHAMLKSLLKYYGFLLPPRMKIYGEKKLQKERKLKKTSYDKVTEIQLYLYSYLAHMPLDEHIMTMLKGSLNDNEIANLLMVQHVLNPVNVTEENDSVTALLNSPQYFKCLNKKDRKLLLHISLTNSDGSQVGLPMESQEEENTSLHEQKTS